MAEETPGVRIGRRIRTLREEGLITQPELATRSDVGVASIRNIETGLVAHPRRSTVERLAEALGVRLEDLMGQPRPLDEPPPEAWPLSLARMLEHEHDEVARVRDLEGASPQELSHLLRDIERQRAIAGREMVRAEPAGAEDWRRYLNRLEELSEEIAPYVGALPPAAQEMAATLASGAA